MTATQTEEMFSIVSVVHGHHVYKSVQTPLLGERLLVRPKKGNNLPHELLRTMWHFIFAWKPRYCEVTGKRKLGNGLEVARIHRKMFFVFKENFFAGLE